MSEDKFLMKYAKFMSLIHKKNLDKYQKKNAIKGIENAVDRMSESRQALLDKIAATKLRIK
jgi:hypothetical protein